MNLRQLGIELSSLRELAEPDASLEQWETPGRIAAEVLFEVKRRGDLTSVVDLGCGTGRFAIGAAFLGAESVVGIDIDPRAVEIARENAERAGVEVEFRQGDVFSLDESFHTAIQNPPFGTVNEKEDTRFLKKALSVAEVVYTLHPHPSASFINRLAGGGSELLATYRFPLKARQPFHRKRKSSVACDLWRVVS